MYDQGGNQYAYQQWGGYDPNAPPPPNGPQQYGGNYYHQPNMGMPGMENFNPVLTNMAKQYGETLVGQGKEMVDQKFQKFVSVSKLKYYFAVDTAYVMKKLGLLFFPFVHKVSPISIQLLYFCVYNALFVVRRTTTTCFTAGVQT